MSQPLRPPPGPHLRHLESEAVFVLREVAAQFERPVLLFSGGKDSIVLVEVARRAFAPGPLPFPLLHVDTGHNFPETLTFRDEMVARLGLRLIVRLVEDSIANGRVHEEHGPQASRNMLQTVTLLDALAEFRFDAALGGARRDEEKARAKERFFSHRNRFGQWEPRHQRPELWNLFNGRKHAGEHFRIFPLSNWTELDVWQYIEARAVPVPSLYFAHRRDIVRQNGMLMAASLLSSQPGDASIETRTVRFRTIGDITCTGAVESNSRTVSDVIAEVAAARLAERSSRADDHRA
ncbi:MAG: sulfate adenylyltransferase subunit CysD, partial [Caldilineaceae bacterium]